MSVYRFVPTCRKLFAGLILPIPAIPAAQMAIDLKSLPPVIEVNREMAASFFGEIVEPASRAFFDFGEDDFDEESSTEKCEFKITWKTEAPRYDTVLVFHGKISNAFADRSFLDQGLCCGTVEKVTKQKDAATFYSLQNDILALSVTAVDDIHSVPFIDCLDEIISKTKRVVVICSLPAARYLGEQRIEDGLLRCLVTSAKIEDLEIKCTTLEQPNFVPGVPAACKSHTISIYDCPKFRALQL
ncbi:Hypothetical predicted protein [Cloeon dipterum]|uniref:Proteasome assembly chaperone 1 n=1 Tax=Cloeon dipterum TaxID=197152 RepID=A0A8S1BZE9_9INSE|nr:Hypothetical predicted protein [Cloeon dipterum]